MMKTIIFATAGAVFSMNALAELPHTFKNGEVADADEVNANFKYLNDEIKKVADKPNEYLSSAVHPYSRQPISANIGDIVEINSRKFIIVAVPFIDFGDGSRHAVKFPAPYCEQQHTTQTCELPNFHGVYLNTSHIKTPLVGNITVSGHPATVVPSEGMSYRYQSTYDYSTQQRNHTFSIEEQVTPGHISIQVGETRLSMGAGMYYSQGSPQYNSVKHQNMLLNTVDADFTDDINWDLIQQHKLDHQEIYRYLDYYEVIDLPAPTP